jgi:ribosomal-protein-alanine N-acetyltransferase
VFAALLRSSPARAEPAGRCPFAVVVDGRLAGQMHGEQHRAGAFDGGHVGYWVDERVAGRGVCRPRWRLVLDHCFGPVGLHRVQADVRPENSPSRRVVDKLGFRRRGCTGSTCSSTSSGATTSATACSARTSPGGRPARYLARRLNFPRRARRAADTPGRPLASVAPVGSGLILLVIVGAWLAFFVQLALRSNETTNVLGTVDKFHDAMRVLSRRQAAPAPER